MPSPPNFAPGPLSSQGIPRLLTGQPVNTNGLVCWLMGSAIGPNRGIPDLSGSGINVTSSTNSGIRPCSTPFGPGFNNTSGALGVVDPGSVLTSPNWTFCTWFMRNSTAAAGGLFRSGASSQASSSFSTGGTIQTSLGGVLKLNSVAGVVNQANVWFHVALTFDGTTLRLFVNGVQNAAATTSTASTLSQWVFFNVGGVAFSGAATDTRVYNRPLSASEIYNIYASSFIPGFEWEMMPFVSANTIITHFSAAPGAFSFTPSASTLLLKRRFVAAPAAFALTPSASTLKTVRRMAAAPGAYAFTAAASTLKAIRKLAAAPGAFTFSPSSATLTKIGGSMTYGLAADPATIAYSARAATLKTVRKQAANPAAFTFTGAATTLTYIPDGGASSVPGVMTAVWTATATLDASISLSADMGAVWSI